MTCSLSTDVSGRVRGAFEGPDLQSPAVDALTPSRVLHLSSSFSDHLFCEKKFSLILLAVS